MNASTRPLIMMQVPQMVTQVVQMDYKWERQEKTEEMKGQPIEEIIEQQNIPRLIDRRVNSSILLPTQFLAVMVYYFIYGEANVENKSMSNKGVADLFKLVLSNLHKLVSGKKYHGGSQTWLINDFLQIK